MAFWYRRFGWALGLLALCFAAPAHAVFNISSPGVKEGVFGVELRNRWDFDGASAGRDGYRNHVLKLDYGLTKRLALELQGKIEKRHLESYRFYATEPELKIRFYDPGDYWLDSAIKLAYEIGHRDNLPDRAKFKLLLGKRIEQWSGVANINLGKEVGPDATRDTTLDIGWQVKYRLHKQFDPGIEVYHNWGEFSRTGDYESQRHRIGPMFYGEILPGVKYQFGYLFGLSDAAEDGSFKLFLRYEIPL